MKKVWQRLHRLHRTSYVCVCWYNESVSSNLADVGSPFNCLLKRLERFNWTLTFMVVNRLVDTKSSEGKPWLSQDEHNKPIFSTRRHRYATFLPCTCSLYTTHAKVLHHTVMSVGIPLEWCVDTARAHPGKICGWIDSGYKIQPCTSRDLKLHFHHRKSRIPPHPFAIIHECLPACKPNKLNKIEIWRNACVCVG